jgi:hypothetical protein
MDRTTQLRRVEVADRLDMRSNPMVSRGRGPDCEEPPPNRGALEELDVQSAERGFWKKSEFERCRAGLNFVAGDLNYERFQTTSWRRAREAMK